MTYSKTAELNERIAAACATTPDGTRARSKALAACKWRLKYGLLYAGLKPGMCSGGGPVLVSKDDPRCMVFDGRDNEEIKAGFYGVILGCKFEVELL